MGILIEWNEPHHNALSHHNLRDQGMCIVADHPHTNGKGVMTYIVAGIAKGLGGIFVITGNSSKI